MADSNWHNRTLFVADNIHILRGMNSESVDCIATDPPFNAKRVFNAPLGSKSASQRFDDRWRWDEVTDEWQDLIASDHPAIKEIVEAAAVIEGGKIDHRTGKIATGALNSIAAYLAYMAPRIVEMHRVLKPSGVLFLQCDGEANAYLRLLLDAVFGRSLVINEITVRRNMAKGFPTRRLPRNSDTVLAYGKSREWKWNPSHEPYDLANLDEKTARQYSKMEDGRRYQLTSLVHPEGNRPNLTYEFLGVTRVWRWTRERMEAAYAEGRVVQSAPGNVPRFKRYLDEQPGRKRDDIWNDLGQAESNDVEWSTRKPVSLYRRLIECATDEGDTVCDPFAGCATTCVAAEQLQRGMDRDRHRPGGRARHPGAAARRNRAQHNGTARHRPAITAAHGHSPYPGRQAATGSVGAAGPPVRQPVLRFRGVARGRSRARSSHPACPGRRRRLAQPDRAVRELQRAKERQGMGPVP